MNYKQYRNKFRNKAKVIFEECGSSDCEGILCPLPLFCSDIEITKATHVCMTGFKEKGL